MKPVLSQERVSFGNEIFKRMSTIKMKEMLDNEPTPVMTHKTTSGDYSGLWSVKRWNSLSR